MTDLLYTDGAGRKWKRFSCKFSSPDGTYHFDIWALSHDHALLQLDSLKENAEVVGEIQLEIPCDDMPKDGE